MLKKLLALMLLAVMLFAFTACGDEPTTEGDNNTTETQSDAADNTVTESEQADTNKDDAVSKVEESSKPTATSKPVSSKEKEEKVTSIDTAGLSGWKKAYAEAINDNLKYYTKFALVYVNNDSVPELFMKAKSSKSSDIICAYSNNKAVLNKLSKNGKASYYIEKGSVVYQEYEVMANKTDITVYRFESGFEKLCYGRFNNDNTNYLMSGELGLVATEKMSSVTEQEFNDKIASFIDLSKAKELDANLISLSEVAKKLK